MDIEKLANEFRKAIDLASDEGEFNDDFPFDRFPCGCCGDASYLLAQYLLNHRVRTYYVCGTYCNRRFEGIQSHAWLLVDNQIIIDITGDQFRNKPEFLYYDKTVYTGMKDEFHDLFKVNNWNVYENKGLDSLARMYQTRLNTLYKKIMKYISD